MTPTYPDLAGTAVTEWQRLRRILHVTMGRPDARTVSLRQAGNPILAMEDQAKMHEAEKAAAAAKL